MHQSPRDIFPRIGRLPEQYVDPVRGLQKATSFSLVAAYQRNNHDLRFFTLIEINQLVCFRQSIHATHLEIVDSRNPDSVGKIGLFCL